MLREGNMSKKDTTLDNDMLVADALLRLRALENLLVAKGLITKEEFSKEIDAVARQVAKSILEKAGVPGELDKLLDSLKNEPKKDIGN